MGANHQQEIALLAGIAQPTHGLITNIGKGTIPGRFWRRGRHLSKARGSFSIFCSKKERNRICELDMQDIIMDMVSKRRAFGKIVYNYCSKSWRGRTRH